MKFRKKPIVIEATEVLREIKVEVDLINSYFEDSQEAVLHKNDIRRDE